MDELTLDDALELFQLPRTLATGEDGQPIVVAIGRFGPYVQYGPKKYVSLKKEDDPYTVTLERAKQLIREKLELDANRIIREFAEDGIQVLNGRYGPYITDGKRNGKVPKDREPASLTLEECKALLEAAPLRGSSRFGRRGAAAKSATTTGTPAAAEKKAPARKTAAKRKSTAKKKGTASKSPAAPPRKSA